MLLKVKYFTKGPRRGDRAKDTECVPPLDSNTYRYTDCLRNEAALFSPDLATIRAPTSAKNFRAPGPKAPRVSMQMGATS